MSNIAPAPLASARTLRVLSYNVHRCVGTDRHLSPERVAAVIAACQPDIVALQELDVGRKRSGNIDQAEIIADLLRMRYHFYPALQSYDEMYGDAVFSNLPMRLIKAGPLPALSHARFAEPRGALWVAVDCQGCDLQLINTHLSLDPREHFHQTNMLLGPEWMGSPQCHGPTVFVGDLNALAWSASYKCLLARFKDAQQGLSRRPQSTFPSWWPFLRIDHAFVDPSIEVIDCRPIRTSLSKKASDHLPLTLDIRFQAQSLPPWRPPGELVRPECVHASARE